LPDAAGDGREYLIDPASRPIDPRGLRVNHCGYPRIWTNGQVIRSGDHSSGHSSLYKRRPI